MSLGARSAFRAACFLFTIGNVLAHYSRSSSSYKMGGYKMGMPSMMSSHSHSTSHVQKVLSSLYTYQTGVVWKYIGNLYTSGDFDNFYVMINQLGTMSESCGGNDKLCKSIDAIMLHSIRTYVLGNGESKCNGVINYLLQKMASCQGVSVDEMIERLEINYTPSPEPEQSIDYSGMDYDYRSTPRPMINYDRYEVPQAPKSEFQFNNNYEERKEYRPPVKYEMPRYIPPAPKIEFQRRPPMKFQTPPSYIERPKFRPPIKFQTPAPYIHEEAKFRPPPPPPPPPPPATYREQEIKFRPPIKFQPVQHGYRDVMQVYSTPMPRQYPAQEMQYQYQQQPYRYEVPQMQLQIQARPTPATYQPPRMVFFPTPAPQIYIRPTPLPAIKQEIQRVFVRPEPRPIRQQVYIRQPTPAPRAPIIQRVHIPPKQAIRRIEVPVPEMEVQRMVVPQPEIKPEPRQMHAHPTQTPIISNMVVSSPRPHIFQGIMQAKVIPIQQPSPIIQEIKTPIQIQPQIQEQAHERIEERIQEQVPQPVQESVRVHVPEPVQEAVHVHVPEPVQESVRVHVPEPVQEVIRQPVQEQVVQEQSVELGQGQMHVHGHGHHEQSQEQGSSQIQLQSHTPAQIQEQGQMLVQKEIIPEPVKPVLRTTTMVPSKVIYGQVDLPSWTPRAKAQIEISKIRTGGSKKKKKITKTTTRKITETVEKHEHEHTSEESEESTVILRIMTAMPVISKDDSNYHHYETLNSYLKSLDAESIDIPDSYSSKQSFLYFCRKLLGNLKIGDEIKKAARFFMKTFGKGYEKQGGEEIDLNLRSSSGGSSSSSSRVPESYVDYGTQPETYSEYGSEYKSSGGGGGKLSLGGKLSGVSIGGGGVSIGGGGYQQSQFGKLIQLIAVPTEKVQLGYYNTLKGFLKSNRVAEIFTAEAKESASDQFKRLVFTILKNRTVANDIRQAAAYFAKTIFFNYATLINYVAQPRYDHEQNYYNSMKQFFESFDIYFLMANLFGSKEGSSTDMIKQILLNIIQSQTTSNDLKLAARFYLSRKPYFSYDVLIPYIPKPKNENEQKLYKVIVEYLNGDDVYNYMKDFYVTDYGDDMNNLLKNFFSITGRSELAPDSVRVAAKFYQTIFRPLKVAIQKVLTKKLDLKSILSDSFDFSTFTAEQYDAYDKFFKFISESPTVNLEAFDMWTEKTRRGEFTQLFFKYLMKEFPVPGDIDNAMKLLTPLIKFNDSGALII